MLIQIHSHWPRAGDELLGMQAKKTPGLDGAGEGLCWGLGEKMLDGEEEAGRGGIRT